jgi:ribonuclease-3
MPVPKKKIKAAQDLAPFEKTLGYKFKNPALLDLALSHRSHGHESGKRLRNNESLEFVGDAILGFVVAEELYKAAGPRTLVGSLARKRSSLVSETSLAAIARDLDIGGYLQLGKGEAATGGRNKSSLLSDTFEAILAAIYLDGGMAAARKFIFARFPEGFKPGSRNAVDDPKTLLQEKLQARGRPLPSYKVASSAGPDHDRSFIVDVVIGGKKVASGEGRSKKTASIEAARQALKKFSAVVKTTKPV